MDLSPECSKLNTTLLADIDIHLQPDTTKTLIYPQVFRPELLELHLRLSVEDIKVATANVDKEIIIGESSLGQDDELDDEVIFSELIDQPIFSELDGEVIFSKLDDEAILSKSDEKVIFLESDDEAILSRSDDKAIFSKLDDEVIFSELDDIVIFPESKDNAISLQLKDVPKEKNVVVPRSTPGFTQFINDLYLLGGLEHENILSPVEIFEEDNEMFMVLMYGGNGSLDKHLSDPTLTWIQRLRICVGIAQALAYIHFGLADDLRVIHGNVQASKILLDDNWEPKLSGFEFCIVLHKEEQLALISEYRCTLQYMDPAFVETKGLNYKSDVFSFGIVLFEVLFGRIASSVLDHNQDNLSFAQMARHCYEKRSLEDMIKHDLRKQMDSISLRIFADIAYCCLKEQRSQRPDTNQIVKKLERALEHQLKHENPELRRIADKGTSSNQWKGKNLDHLKIRLHEIELATNNFSDTYLIGSGGYGLVYQAELDHYDSRVNLSIEAKEKGEFPKIRSTVAIKRIVNKQGKQGFLAEIEMLTSCKHQNIVSLLGFCDEGPHMILVYEHVSNGSLDDYLGSNLVNVTWSRRIHMCLDIAHGISYLHTSTHDKQMIVHRDIKSANILLGDNLEAKIADFGLSKLRPLDQKNSTLMTNNVAGTEVYLDPEYMKTGKLKKEVDIYSFGVVLFEIMCGKVAYDETYYVDNEKGLPSIARRRFIKGTLKEMVDPKIKEAYENIFMINRGLNQDSLDTFSKIAYQCLAETHSERPTMEFVIKELEKALSFEENHKDSLQILFEDIKLATKNFCHTNCVGRGRYWKAYKGVVPHANDNGRCTTIVAKRWDGKSNQRDHQFLKELDILFRFKHENIVGLAGYCNEMDERIIVYEHEFNGSLDKYLNDSSLTWIKRLKICIDVACGLGFLHSDNKRGGGAIHRGIKSSSILLDADWKAKICNLELSSVVFEKDSEHVIHSAYDTLGYVDPSCRSILQWHELDIYSLGVVLFEILCGRLAWHEGCKDHSESLGPLAKYCYEEGKLRHEMVFEGIKEQIVTESFTTFARVAYQCLNDNIDERPTTAEVVVQLNKALEFQEDYEIGETKLPKDYKEIFQMSKTPWILYNQSKKALYNMLNKGILLQEDTVWVSLGSNGERNEMIPARKFSYKKHWLHRWRSVPHSRFPKVAELLDISNLATQIKIKTQFLTSGVSYNVHLIFKFCAPRKSSAKRMYVNLKYKRGKENLNAYFATWRGDEWMMIKLGLFLCGNEDTQFEVLLESFSRCYCGSRAIYVDGIEFQAIDNVIHEKINKFKEVEQIDNVLKHEEIEKVDNARYDEITRFMLIQRVMKSHSMWDKLPSLQNEVNRMTDHSLNTRFEADKEEMSMKSESYDECEELLSTSKMNTKKHHMLSVNEVSYDASNGKSLHLKPFVQSRFREVVELLSLQVFRIKCKIASQTLLPNTEYACYLVFKFSEKCCGLHCPVIVRDLLRWKNKESGIIYFRTPSPWNLHDNNRVPEKREDGWMEINVWKFNSTYELRNDFIPMNLKLIVYEGTMSGLILCGLEIRPM